MGRQFRPPRSGNIVAFASPTITAASSVITAIPNYGYSDLSAYAAGDYQLAAPDIGVRKTLVRASSTSAAVVVRLSTSGTVSAGTLATTAGTQFTFNATVDQVLTLIGVNSTHWAIESMYPPTAVNATGVVLAGT
jgi:hypothetical protein